MLLLIVILSTVSQVILVSVKSIIYSIDNGDGILSSEMQTLFNYFNSTQYPLVIGSSKLTSVKMDRINVDMNRSISISIPYENGDTATEQFEYLMIRKDGSLLKANNIMMNYQKNNQTISSIGYDYLSKNNKSKDVVVNCNFTLTNFSYNVINSSTLNDFFTTDDITKIDQYNYFTFILKSSKLYTISYSNVSKTIVINQVEAIDDTNEKLSEKIIDNFFLIYNTQLNVTILAVVINNSSNKKDIILYKISNEEENSENIIQYIYVGKLDNVSGEYRINKIMMYNRNVIIAIQYQGLKVLAFQNNNGFNEQVILDSPTNIIDFVINNSTIYAIGENKGMYVIDLKSSSSKKIFYRHSHLKNIDIFINPFTGYKYIGVLTEMQKDNEEFFIEFYIKNETVLRLHKIYTSQKKRNVISFIRTDNFFSYFLDTSSNSILLLRRGMLNSIPFISYNISSISDTITNIFPVYNSTSKMNVLSYTTNSYNHIFHLSNLTLPKHYMNCNFTKSGLYLMRLIHFTDSCGASLNGDKEYNICQKMLDFNFWIVGDIKGKTVSITVIFILCVFGVLLIGIFITLIITTKCFKQNKLKVNIGINIENRKLLYEEEFDNLNEEDRFTDDNTANNNNIELQRNQPNSERKFVGRFPSFGSANQLVVPGGEQMNKSSIISRVDNITKT